MFDKLYEKTKKIKMSPCKSTKSQISPQKSRNKTSLKEEETVLIDNKK